MACLLCSCASPRPALPAEAPPRRLASALGAKEGQLAAPREYHDRTRPTSKTPPGPLVSRGPLRVTAERYEDQPDASKVARVSVTATGHYLFTGDSRQLVFGDHDGLWAIDPGTRERRLLARGPRPYFNLTPDSRYALTPGKSVSRIALRDGRSFELAASAPLSPLDALVVSPDSHWFAYTAGSGPLTVVSVEEDLAHALDVPLPEDRRYHAGAGHLVGFSDDSKLLLYQRGAGYEVIGRDGSGRRALTPAAGVLFGRSAIAQGEQGFTLVPLEGGEPRQISTPLLNGFSVPRPAPDASGFAFLAADEGVYWADARTLQVRRLSPEGAHATMFIEVTPDSRGVLYVNRHREGEAGWCEGRFYDLAKGRDVMLARFEDTEQCFPKVAGVGKAVLYEWHAVPDGVVPVYPHVQGNVFVVDLERLVVRRVTPTVNQLRNVHVAPDGRFAAFDSGSGPTGYELRLVQLGN